MIGRFYITLDIRIFNEYEYKDINGFEKTENIIKQKLFDYLKKLVKNNSKYNFNVYLYSIIETINEIIYDNDDMKNTKFSIFNIDWEWFNDNNDTIMLEYYSKKYINESTKKKIIDTILDIDFTNSKEYNVKYNNGWVWYDSNDGECAITIIKNIY